MSHLDVHATFEKVFELFHQNGIMSLSGSTLQIMRAIADVFLRELRPNAYVKVQRASSLVFGSGGPFIHDLDLEPLVRFKNALLQNLQHRVVDVGCDEALHV